MVNICSTRCPAMSKDFPAFHGLIFRAACSLELPSVCPLHVPRMAMSSTRGGDHAKRRSGEIAGGARAKVHHAIRAVLQRAARPRGKEFRSVRRTVHQSRQGFGRFAFTGCHPALFESLAWGGETGKAGYATELIIRSTDPMLMHCLPEFPDCNLLSS